MKLMIQTKGYVFDNYIRFYKISGMTIEFKESHGLSSDTIRLVTIGDRGLEVTFTCEVEDTVISEYEVKLQELDLSEISVRVEGSV